MSARACPICRRENVEFEKLFEKRLSQEDKQGSHGAYIPKNDAVKLCGGQLANENGDSIDLPFYDVQNRRWEMRLRRSGRKHFLTGEWRQFFCENDQLIREGRTVTFYRLSCPSCTGENIGYTIGVLQLFGQPIIA